MDSKTLRASIQSLDPSEPTCVSLGTPVSEIIDIMQENKFGCVLVVDNEQLVGIFTERDVLTKIVGSNLAPEQTSVETVMSMNPEYLYVYDEIAYALNRMQMGGFRHIPLINAHGNPIGVVSMRDITDFLVKSLVTSN